MNWITYNEYVDIDTGELVPVFDRNRFKEEWQIINKDKRVKIEDNTGTVTYTNLVRKINTQLKLF